MFFHIYRLWSFKYRNATHKFEIDKRGAYDFVTIKAKFRDDNSAKRLIKYATTGVTHANAAPLISEHRGNAIIATLHCYAKRGCILDRE